MLRTYRRLAAMLVCTMVVVAIGCTSKGQGARNSADSRASNDALAALRAEVTQLKDRQQIHDVHLRFFRGVDRNDAQLVKSAFWPDVQINYGTTSESLDEHVQKFVTNAKKRNSHFITNESMDIDGDTAHVESYIIEMGSPDNGKSMIVAGRLIDRLDRRDGEWRIAVSEFIPSFLTQTDVAIGSFIKEESWSPRSACGMGTWDKRDPSYRRPLTARADSAKDAGTACTD